MGPPSDLSCSMCHRPYPADDVNLAEALAFCSVCNTVRDLPANAAALQRPGAEPPAPLPPAARPRQPLPKGFKVEELPGCLRVSWKEPIDGPLAGFLLWLFLPLYFVFNDGPSHSGANGALYLAVFVLGTLGFAAVLAAKLVNFTSVSASREQLLVEHGPIPVPWRRPRRLLVADIEQLFSCRYTGGESTYFGVGAIAKVDGDWRTVVSGLIEPAQALYLEQQFERRLRLVDRPVKGELERGPESAVAVQDSASTRPPTS